MSTPTSLSGSMSSNPVPIVDFRPFVNPSASQDERAGVAKQMFDALRTMGFVYLINYDSSDGSMQEKVRGMFEWSKRFFDLPLETKSLAPHPPSGSHHRGYSRPGMETVKKFNEDGTPTAPDSVDEKSGALTSSDFKESFECGKEGSESMPNIWLPEGVLPGFKEVCLDFFWDCFRLELVILRALALGLGIQEDYFLDSHTIPDNQLRLLHYPPTSRSRLESGETVRIGAHADFGSITLLFQDDVGGLEVEDPQRQGVFLPVPPVEKAVIVNAGDFLMRWSNDIIKSTVHRVRAPSHAVAEDGMTSARYSIPYFCAPDLNQVVDCIPGTWDENRAKKYEATSAMDYILKRLTANY